MDRLLTIGRPRPSYHEYDLWVRLRSRRRDILPLLSHVSQVWLWQVWKYNLVEIKLLEGLEQ